MIARFLFLTLVLAGLGAPVAAQRSGADVRPRGERGREAAEVRDARPDRSHPKARIERRLARREERLECRLQRIERLRERVERVEREEARRERPVDSKRMRELRERRERAGDPRDGERPKRLRERFEERARERRAH